MRPYETMIIFDAEVEDNAINAVLNRALDVVRANGGKPGAVERWGKRAFAYELKKKREGYYVVAEYSAEPVASAELERFLGLADEVLRHKIVRLPDKVARGPRTKVPPPAAAAPAAAAGKRAGDRS